ncbi:MAG: hypothetical protein O9331_18070 [Acidovorax sp.]|jgi:hypothetical protein|uniref:hypothetical protein n=1 Tax=Acidovorax sp. 106 TaxID=2135637 RepID=UPI000EAC6255|nr:hypothetical protein [Acidovorax sp. 106]MCZ8095384.1 hypothetical protein [Acidovorax sp.]RLJ39269.1 hypothetical protein C8C98_3008 [Acidovorax sp. 106]
MTHFFRPSVLATLALGLSALCSVASAKLPAPSPEAAEKAAEAAAKAAWAGKVDNYKLCQSQDRVAAHYRKSNKDAKPAAAVPACAEPGPFAYTPPAAKPQEAAGAHSPPGTASSPPSTNTPAASAPKS